MTATAPPQPQPASAFEPLVLLQMLREVAKAAQPEHPERISTRAWDRGRTLSDQFADAPAARRICEYLELGWTKLLELALLPAAGQRIALGHALNERQGNWLTPEYSDYVLRLVARRLNEPTLTPGRYRAERNRMLTADRCLAHGGQLRIPTEDQIAALAGTWDQALAHAGLNARPAPGRQRPRQRPLTVIEALERCYEHYEAEPTSTELDAFAKANNLAVARDRSRTWVSYIEEWKAGRRAAGLSSPDGPPARHQRWDYTQNIGAARPGERRRKARTHDELVQWLVCYLAQLGPRQRSTERGYNDWAADQPGAPLSRAFDSHGDWSAMRATAQTRLRRLRRTGAGEPRPPVVQHEPATSKRHAPVSARGRRATATLAELVATRGLHLGEQLHGAYKGRRWHATFDAETGVVSVDGAESFDSLTAAAMHCHGGGAVSGFAFWGVERDGRIVKLAKLRAD
jgi:hypothetical protein